MGLQTFSDPGAVAHAGEALRATQSADQEYAQLEQQRAETDLTRIKSLKALQEIRGQDPETRERAARSLGIAVDELGKLGVSAADLNFAADFDFLEQHNPDLANQLRQAFPNPSQQLEASVVAAKARMGIESQQRQAAKASRYEAFMRQNRELAEAETGGGAGDQKAENPLITDLRTAAQDPQIDDAAFEAQVVRAERMLADQTAKQIAYDLNLSKAQKLYSEGAGSISSRDRGRAAQIMGLIKHASTEDADKLLMELSVLMTGYGDKFREAMDESAKEGAAAVVALLRAEEDAAAEAGAGAGGSPSRGALLNRQPGAQPGPRSGAQPREAGTQPTSGPGQKADPWTSGKSQAGGGAMIKPAATQEEGVARIQEWVESSRNSRGLIHGPTLLATASAIMGRDIGRDELRDLLRPAREKAVSAEDDQILVDRLTVSGRAKTEEEARKQIESMTPEERKAELDKQRAKSGGSKGAGKKTEAEKKAEAEKKTEAEKKKVKKKGSGGIDGVQVSDG